jgi:hypothetical protein
MAIPNTNILPGSPPLLWSNIHEAFKQINENFTSLDLATGGSAVDLETLDTNVSPADNDTYQLGSETNKWKSVYTAGYLDSPASEFNGVWLGTAHIKGIGSTIEIPFASTIGGELINNPDQTFYQSIQVDNENSLIAQIKNDELFLNSGTAIQLVVDSSAAGITFNNTGVTSLIASTGVSISGGTGDVTITNTGVTSLTNTETLPSGRTPGTGVNVSSNSGDVAITNTGVISIEAGSAALTVSTDAATGIVTITNPAPAVNSFVAIEVDGDFGDRIAADTTTDVLYINGGEGIALTKNTGTDTLTITVNPVFDLTGSVFADDSSIMVDAVDHVFYGDLIGNVTGNVTGNADSATVASTVTLVATNSTAATHYITFVDTATGNEDVRTDTDLTYNPSTNTLTAGTFSGDVTGTLTGNIFTSLIDSADSSAITVTPAAIFSSDVTVENELTSSRK